MTLCCRSGYSALSEQIRNRSRQKKTCAQAALRWTCGQSLDDGGVYVKSPVDTCRRSRALKAVRRHALAAAAAPRGRRIISVGGGVQLTRRMGKNTAVEAMEGGGVGRGSRPSSWAAAGSARVIWIREACAPTPSQLKLHRNQHRTLAIEVYCWRATNQWSVCLLRCRSFSSFREGFTKIKPVGATQQRFARIRLPPSLKHNCRPTVRWMRYL